MQQLECKEIISKISQLDKTTYKIENDTNDQFIYIKMLQKNLK